MSTNETYRVTIGTNECHGDGSPKRYTAAEFQSLEEAIEYEEYHGGVIERDSDGKCMAPDGAWV